MKVFVTGASGFVGSAVVQELLDAGHSVIGLARSEDSAKAIKEAGAEVLLGGLQDVDVLQKGTQAADGVIHTAFFHDFNQYEKASEMDKTAIEAIGEVIAGTDKPLVVTGGSLGLPLFDGYVTEESIGKGGARKSEETALALAEKGIHASIVRLAPSVHDKGDKGFVPFIIGQARKHGVSAYPLDGTNRWPAVHRRDAAKVFRLALEKSAIGALYNAIGDEGIPVKKIAELIGEKLHLPAVSLSDEELAKHFEWMSYFIQFDSPAKSLTTQAQLGWTPTHIGLLDDMSENYF